MALRQYPPPERFESEMFPSRLACLICIVIANPTVAQGQIPPVLDCTGPFARNADERTLARFFGAENVERANIPVGEGNTEPGTVIFAKDPEKRIDILWHDAYARPNVVIIRNASTSRSPTAPRLRRSRR
jgi:hypothetical protein